jgi:hypothetical protein
LNWRRVTTRSCSIRGGFASLPDRSDQLHASVRGLLNQTGTYDPISGPDGLHVTAELGLPKCSKTRRRLSFASFRRCNRTNSRIVRRLVRSGARSDFPRRAGH